MQEVLFAKKFIKIKDFITPIHVNKYRLQVKVKTQKIYIKIHLQTNEMLIESNENTH